MEPANHAIGIFFAIVTAVSWTGASFCIKQSLRDVPVLKFTATMTILNALFVAVITIVFVPLTDLSHMKSATWVFIFLAGALHFGISRFFLNAAIGRIGPSRTIPVANSFPLITAFMATVILGEPLTVRILLGLALLFSGISLVVRAKPAIDAPGDPPDTRRKIAGWVFAGLSSLLMGVSAVFFKSASLDSHPLIVSTLALLTGAAVGWLIVGVSKKSSPRRKISSRGWRWILATVVCQTMAIPFYNSAFTYTLAVHVASIASTQPLIAIPIGFIFMRETENITRKLIAGAALTVGGMLLVIV